MPSSNNSKTFHHEFCIAEIKKRRLEFERELKMKIFYDGEHVGLRRVDFFYRRKIIVALKPLSKWEDVHLAQAMNYCLVYNLPSGMLINFGAKNPGVLKGV